MNAVPIYIAGIGIVSALGCGMAATREALFRNQSALRPPAFFKVSRESSLPVGRVDCLPEEADAFLPRTHRLARLAADQALDGCGQPPDAIVLGSTTGGILTSEGLLEKKATDPAAYRFHGLASVAEDLARRTGCCGPVLTVSTACSSGAVAIRLAMELLRSGAARTVLAGGADSLCRLTYFGFKSLQLIDAVGARPLDLERRGMSVGEGAALLLLTATAPAAGAVQILGAGLSCDAHHATTPHPEGAGALAAMRTALADAGLMPADIDYINLHGTGTIDNDLAEARAIHTLFDAQRPPLSSIKGATGHPLAAAGAIEAAVAAICIEQGMVPANTGYRTFDPQVDLEPLTSPQQLPVATVMSNSFGFGGNNAALIIGKRQRMETVAAAPPQPLPLTIAGYACVTGAGHTPASREIFLNGGACSGCLEEARLSEGLPPRTVRRLKRLPKIALALATRACEGIPAERMPSAVSLGTAWGALSETHDFLQRLFETDQQYPSPTDFIGSVHNAPAGQIAMHLGARGANITTSGGDYSFEQALWSADLLTRGTREAVLVVGADEHHAHLSPLFEPGATAPSDGGGALLLQRDTAEGRPGIAPLFYRAARCPQVIPDLIRRLGGAEQIQRTFGAIMAGLPARHRETAQAQLAAFSAATRFVGPVIDYRRLTGEFAAAAAVAAVMGAAMTAQGMVPGALAGGADVRLHGKRVLLLGLGDYITAIEVFTP